MGYVAVKGGQKAILASSELTGYYRLRHAPGSLDVGMLPSQMRFLVDRVMSEAGFYAPKHAALALKQAQGDVYEAAFLLRAYRSTVPRNHVSLPLDTQGMRLIRRISSAFRDIPGGQILGPTFDYAHRLLQFDLLDEPPEAIAQVLKRVEDRYSAEEDQEPALFPRVSDFLREEGLMAPPHPGAGEEEPFDITRFKLPFPAPRSARLQTMARGETGAMVALAYSSLRGYGAVHPTIGELRVGYCALILPYPLENGESVYAGELLITEVEAINGFAGTEPGEPVQLVLGYGVSFGQNEVKSIAMSVLDRALDVVSGTEPVHDEEYVLSHIDSIESAGFISHLKLPHYVTFQSELDRLRTVRQTPDTGSREGIR
ncbi:MAG: carbon-phosphorus lyase complex subunit PhnI [Firmicutes bacterium]|jgi:alpha-D-ribose 1-methylphosphonate 5-triphosphate synthase subunit PhnI|uniref:Carbon-phosphorus lyase n=1 Tax=Sulfobacillus benefaciens TaxID=453960 RepID=A0A2T2WZC4_9FIRM|nr:carbon-phosphorus lyase complex subunit PhnI [Bacillota bacterium]MCL5013468.1 carbon-phosphorus lyase complex subunit PhnI [Bacillota bacterium]PSR27581.1 MAG: carbon-phosphorus lyase [Sulfobacillus benefaciens]